MNERGRRTPLTFATHLITEHSERTITRRTGFFLDAPSVPFGFAQWQGTSNSKSQSAGPGEELISGRIMYDETRDVRSEVEKNERTYE